MIMAGFFMRFFAVFAFFLFILNGIYSIGSDVETIYIMVAFIVFFIPLLYFGNKANLYFLKNLIVTAVGLGVASFVIKYRHMVIPVLLDIRADFCNVTTWEDFVKLNYRWIHNLYDLLPVIPHDARLIHWIVPSVYALSDIGILLATVFVIYKAAGCLIKTFIHPMEHNNDQPLWEDHKKDAARLKETLSYTDVLGINSPWGEGKTFVVDYFCREGSRKGEFNAIKIEALNYKYDEFDEVLISKIDSYLRDNHIFSIAASGIRSTVMGIHFGELFYRYLQGWNSDYTSTYDELKTKIEHLPENRKILIVFEDLERVKDPEAIKKIWALSEHLASDKAKIIYEYDGNALDNLGLSWKYREKYIPLEMSLTSMTYENVIKNLLSDDEFKSLPHYLKDIILRAPYTILPDSDLNGYPLMDSADRFKVIDFISIRKTKSFLKEIAARIKNDLNSDTTNTNPNSKYDDYKMTKWRIIVGFCFLKFFLHSAYEKIKYGMEQSGYPAFDLENFLTFRISNKTVKLKELGRYRAGVMTSTEIQNFRSHQDNLKNYMAFSLLGYPCTDYFNVKSKDNEKIQEQRNWVNHIIAHLIQSGADEQTGLEKLAIDFIKDILSNSPSEQISEWNKGFKVRAWSGKFPVDLRRAGQKQVESFKRDPSDNNSILLPSDGLTEVARALNFTLYPVPDPWKSYEEILMAFLRFCQEVFKSELKSDSNQKVCEVLNLVDISSKTICLKVLQIFPEGRIVSNYEDEDNKSDKDKYTEDYIKFLNKYIYHIRSFLEYTYSEKFNFQQFTEYESWDNIESKVEELKKTIGNMLDQDKRKQRTIHSVGEPDLIGDLSAEEWHIVTNFLDKNLAVIREIKTFPDN